MIILVKLKNPRITNQKGTLLLIAILKLKMILSLNSLLL